VTQFQRASTRLVCAAVLFVSGAAAAGDDSDGGVRITGPMPAGCYQVARGFIAEQSIDAAHVVGQYNLVLKSTTHPRGQRYVISGPLSGTEDGGEEGGAKSSSAPRISRSAYLASSLESEGPHGGHNLGTDNRIGTMSTEGDTIQVTSASCTDGAGNPRLIKGIETLTFVRGTGAFANLVSGKIDFNLTFDACTKPPQANLVAIQGQICFK
jgi:hypothetical protein